MGFVYSTKALQFCLPELWGKPVVVGRNAYQIFSYWVLLEVHLLCWTNSIQDSCKTFHFTSIYSSINPNLSLNLNPCYSFLLYTILAYLESWNFEITSVGWLQLQYSAFIATWYEFILLTSYAFEAVYYLECLGNPFEWGTRHSIHQTWLKPTDWHEEDWRPTILKRPLRTKAFPCCLDENNKYKIQTSPWLLSTHNQSVSWQSSFGSNADLLLGWPNGPKLFKKNCHASITVQENALESI